MYGPPHPTGHSPLKITVHDFLWGWKDKNVDISARTVHITSSDILEMFDQEQRVQLQFFSYCQCCPWGGGGGGGGGGLERRQGVRTPSYILRLWEWEV